MKALKKLTAVTVAASMMFSLAACSAGSKTASKEKKSAPSVTEAPSNENTEPTVTVAPENVTPEPEASAVYSLSHDGYTLKQVVILGRHNIRSPLSTKDSVLGMATPHEWTQWSSPASELSQRGCAASTIMGMYFRNWLESEGLFPANYHPEEGEVRIYSNSKQRTIATANSFKTGLLPTADTQVEYHVEFDTMDPVFNPQLTFVSDDYIEAVKEEVESLFSEKIRNLESNYKLLTEVLDMKDSDGYKDGTVKDFTTDDLELTLELNKEPFMTGSLKTACSLSDALVLQYYEEADDKKAAFGHELSYEDWKEIGEIKDVYGDVLFSAPLVAANVAHPLLEEIKKELTEEGRVFTYLCGHDSNLSSVLAAMETEEYNLPYTIEAKTPIGCNLVFCRWEDSEGGEFISCDLVYQSSEELRNLTLLDLTTTPICCPVYFSGLTANADGLYPAEEILGRFDEVINTYYDISDEYAYDKAA